MFFIVLGAVCAVDISNASNTEDSNLTNDNVNALSQEKLEVSNEDSISETNLVNSHDDNLDDYPEEDLLQSSSSYYGDNGDQILALANNCSDVVSVSSDDSVVASPANAEVLKNSKVSASLSVSDTYYDASATNFKVTLQDANGKALANQKITLKVKSKSYTGTTDSKGIASIKTTALAVGTYTVSISYAGNANVSSSTLSKKVKVIKDKTSLSGDSKVYILPYNYYTYGVILTSAHGGPVKDCKVSFSYNGKTFTAKTDEKGEAITVIPLLDKGTYKITYIFKGNDGLYSSSSSGTICIKSAANKLIASDLKMNYKDGSKFSVKFTDNKGKVLSGKTITFKLDGKTYTAKTDSKGVAKLAIGDLKPNTYKIKYLYSKLGASDYNYGYKNIVINKLSAKLSAKNLVMKYKDGSEFKVTVKDNSGNIIKNTVVKFTINGKTYSQKTDSKGVAKLKITLPVGYYSIKSVLSNGYYKGSLTKHVLVNGSKFNAGNEYYAHGKTVSYSVQLLDGKSEVIKNAKVKFTVNGKSYTKKTNSKGIATVSLGKLAAGKYTIKYQHDSTVASSKIQVIDKFSIGNIIKASKNVKSYIEKNKKLPSTVKVGSLTISTAEYLYLASQAIVNLNANKKSDIAFSVVKSPSKPGSADDRGNLNNYLSVAKSVIKTSDSKGQMPNSVSSDVGTIGYKGLVYAFARVVAFYGDNSIMPNYVTIKSLTSSSGTTSKLNSKNTISNLAAYLAASTNCQVNNSKIKTLVTKLTKGLTSDKDKATAIFNYVRDTISYSFYYDTKYGAVGTLNAKTGNCVDHSHLLVAMYRTAGLAARYVHGTCTFSSGTYGHVWTQVLIGDTWTVSDATSPRNSFGNVVNWNANSYSLKGYYASIAF